MNVDSEASAKITGRVLMPTGGIEVTCDDMKVETRSDGSYEFSEVKVGRHNVSVQVKSYRKESKTIELSRKDEMVVLDFHLVEASGTANIRGHVYDAETKEPITEGHLSLVLNGPVVADLALMGNKYAEFGKDGYYEFKGLAADIYDIWAVPQGRYVDQKSTVLVGEGDTKCQDFYLEKREEKPQH